VNDSTPVSKDKILGNFDTQKSSAMLLVICEDELLLQEIEHDGGLIYDTFGTFVDETEPLTRLMATQKDNLGTAYELQDSGVITEYINKPLPDGRVKLIVYTYVLLLTTDQKDMLTFKDNWLWFDSKKIDGTATIRQDDKLIFKRVLASKSLNMILEVEQMGRWIDAKLVAWANS
jgi:hypothetical protein